MALLTDRELQNVLINAGMDRHQAYAATTDYTETHDGGKAIHIRFDDADKLDASILKSLMVSSKGDVTDKGLSIPFKA